MELYVICEIFNEKGETGVLYITYVVQSEISSRSFFIEVKKVSKRDHELFIYFPYYLKIPNGERVRGHQTRRNTFRQQ